MPRRTRRGEWEILYIELPKDLALKARLEAQARANRRTVPAELANILEGVLPPLEQEVPQDSREVS
jgi:hypothetical protein